MSPLDDRTYIQYNVVVILVTSFQCDVQAFHIVQWTRSTRGRKHKLTRIETVHLQIGTSLDSLCNASAEYSSVRFRSLLVAEDAELSLIGLIAMVRLFATGPIHQTAGMVIVEEKHQSLMEPSHDENSDHKHRFSIGTT